MMNQIIDNLISGKPIETPVDTVQNNIAQEVAQTQPQPIVELESKSVTQNSTPITTENQGGQEVIIDNVKVNTETGEILGCVIDEEQNPQDLYDSYTRMRQDEKEIFNRPKPSQEKPKHINDDHDEPEMW
ncbi:hypothetical protein AB6F57_21520 [Providencia hangzhouensis]|uniref:hypothetical protein n=1 Tax=Providencia hangzhouensis TaxID=3031799 RepID=UPI0034DDA2E6